MSAIRSMESMHQTLIVLRCKLVLLGDATVGKTALTQMFHSNGHEFPKNYVMTSGAELIVKGFRLDNAPVVVEFYMFDCAGQSIFNQREFGSMHYENASMFVVVYDVANRETFKSLGKWIQEAANATPGHQVPGVLIANKIDLREGNLEAVSTKEGQEFAEQAGLQYFETSALRGDGVSEPFQHMARAFHSNYEGALDSAKHGP